MNWTHDVADNFRLYKYKLELYFEDEVIKDAAKQSRKILRTIGDEGLKKLYGSALTDEDKKKPEKLFNFFETQFPSTKVNFRVHRLQLSKFTINTNESIDSFVTRVRLHAEKCELSEDDLCERIIELVIASTPIMEFKKDLLSQAKGYTVKQLLECGRKFEAIQEGNIQLQILTGDQVDSVKSSYSRNKSAKPCIYCGTKHARRKCPAFDSICELCKKKGHWKAVCRSRNQSRSNHSQQSNRQRNTHRSQVDTYDVESDDQYETTLDTITVPEAINNINVRREVFSTLKIVPPNCKNHNYKIRIKLDSGASGNTIPLRTMKQIYSNEDDLKAQLKQENVKLTAYNGEMINYLGTVYMDLYHNDNCYNTKFYVIDVQDSQYKVPPVLGLQSCEELNLITINLIESNSKPVINLDYLKSAYASCFDTIGEFAGDVTLHLKENAVPYIAKKMFCSYEGQNKRRTRQYGKKGCYSRS